MIKSILQLLHQLLYAIKGIFLPKNKRFYSERLDLVFNLELKKLIDFLIYTNGAFQPEVLNGISYLIDKYNVSMFIDIGSHIGQMSIFVAKKYPQIKVRSYEPNPDTFKRQLENIHLNSAQLEVKNIAFSNEKGFLRFQNLRKRRLAEYFKINDGICFPISDHGPADFEIQCIMLDELADNTVTNDLILIKIDVEGYEKEILQGANLFLSSGSVIFLIELLFDLHLEKSLECVEILNSYGFQMYDLQLRSVNINQGETKNGDYIFLRQ